MTNCPYLTLDVLKNKVLTTTPRESMYLIKVGNKGITLYFCLSLIEMQSRFSYSPPRALVQPSRFPYSSVRIT